MKHLLKSVLLAFLISTQTFAQNSREEIERNRVRHATITSWTRNNDGTLTGNRNKVEKEYDTSGNNISIVIRSQKSPGADSARYEYDELNRQIEVTTYHLKKTSLTPQFLERERHKYDEKGNLVYYSLENRLYNKECQYSYKFDKAMKLIQKGINCSGDRTQNETVDYVYDKKGNLVEEKSNRSRPVIYFIEYWKGTNQIESLLNLSNSRKEFYDSKGVLIKITQAGHATLFKYDDKGNVIELTEHSQSSITGPKIFKQVFDEANHLIEKIDVTGKGNFTQPKRWSYSEASLLIEYQNGDTVEKYEYHFFN